MKPAHAHAQLHVDAGEITSMVCEYSHDPGRMGICLVHGAGEISVWLSGSPAEIRHFANQVLDTVERQELRSIAEEAS